jgi:hypothetical protein
MATVLDPSLRFEVDQGYSVRRALHSRPRRLVQLDYTNLTTAQIRVFRDFLQQHRLTVTPFSYLNAVYGDAATASNTTPIVLTVSHAFMTGQWVGIFSAFHASLDGFWQVTRLGPTTFSLMGSTALGEGACRVYTYFPYAIGYFPEDTWQAPHKHIGPETADNDQARFAMQVTIEEIF